MKYNKYIIMVCMGALMSCTDLDIPPKNFFGSQEIFGSAEGVTSYMAQVYEKLPMEDFRYYYDASGLFNNNDVKWKQQSCLTGEAVGRDTRGTDKESASYWDGAYKVIRDINIFLDEFPEYASMHTETEAKRYIGEAYFARAYVYYALAKRYGGVPVVDAVIDYPSSVTIEGTKLFRNSEEATWDFIGEDLDRAIANLPTTKYKDRANRYTAAAFKSRAMLHAGSIAKYNTVEEIYNNARICGIPAARANDYFKAAYEAAKIVDGGGYELYKGDWSATDKMAQADNFTNIFLKDNNEHIFVRYFTESDRAHGFDNSAQPRQTSSGGNDSELCPTLDFVEMFEGFEKDASGRIANFDNNGYYKLYNSPLDIFADCEPRLRGTVILPMDMFKDQSIELRRGIWMRPVGAGITALMPVGDAGNYGAVYGSDSDLKLGADLSESAGNPILLKDGVTKMTKSGKSGIVSNWDFGNVSGFYLRKYLNPAQMDNAEGKSSQSWIDIRYAEVLLNKAEAAFELHLAGVTTSESGDNHKEEAYKAINLIRERAGATQMTASTELNDIDIVRTERRKELAFEHKTYWDLKRWRIIDAEQNNRRFRTLNAFYAWDVDKYFVDVKYQEPRGGVDYLYIFDTRNYYQQIPGGETTKNPNCKQNPGW